MKEIVGVSKLHSIQEEKEEEMCNFDQEDFQEIKKERLNSELYLIQELKEDDIEEWRLDSSPVQEELSDKEWKL